MSLFVDTSALLAIIDADQERHNEVARVWHGLLDAGKRLCFASNYVLVETFALVQRRLDFDAMRNLANAAGSAPSNALVGRGYPLQKQLLRESLPRTATALAGRLRKVRIDAPQ